MPKRADLPIDAFRSVLGPKPDALPTIQLVGVGSVGLQILRMLFAMSFDRIEIFDDDNVDETNVHTQCYPHSTIGLPKVDAALQVIQELRVPQLQQIVDTYTIRLPDDDIRIYDDGVLFLCVDSMASRRDIFESCRPRLVIDTRCAAETVHILTCTDSRESRNLYRSSLFADNEASPEPCGYRSTIYNATLAACMAIHQLTRHLRGIPTEASVMYHQMANSLVATPNPEPAP